MANKLSLTYPHLVHIEAESFTHPTFKESGYLYFKHYNYTNNYSIHLYYKSNHYFPHNESELAGYDCTVGDVMREVLYGSPHLRSTRKWKGDFIVAPLYKKDKRKVHKRSWCHMRILLIIKFSIMFSILLKNKWPFALILRFLISVICYSSVTVLEMAPCEGCGTPALNSCSSATRTF